MKTNRIKKIKNLISNTWNNISLAAESRRIEYDETDTTQDEIQRRLGYRPDGRLPDLGAVQETTRLDRDNMDYKRPLKEGMRKNRCFITNLYQARNMILVYSLFNTIAHTMLRRKKSLGRRLLASNSRTRKEKTGANPGNANF